MVTVAIAVSRVQAVVMASMLRSAGIMVHIHGDHHASAEAISLALGGHRLMVPAWQWEAASAVIREAELPGSWEFCSGPAKALWRFVGVYFGAELAIGLLGVLTVPGLPAGNLLAGMLVNVPATVLAARGSPQGPAEFFLAPTAS
ncbi:putative signal transducing protein [Paraurantiacibacter namhicola]|uniref:DUF2007 domain-containing protein n=1 Tax=Paraurantiacibacter namhicola TaxID=645517 RepID=A0A1C7D5Z3_9SPHN|nr:DUF2007 domain-containing protein [Paraurantiacibacter namhicola]ANU06751.1 hypothetical protein A6F65_00426 [Paraurantiacibacter namhicola]